MRKPQKKKPMTFKVALGFNELVSLAQWPDSMVVVWNNRSGRRPHWTFPATITVHLHPDVHDQLRKYRRSHPPAVASGVPRA